MSVRVSLDAVQSQLDAFGANAYLLTVGEDQRPHVASVIVSATDDGLCCGAGRSSRANLAHQPTATLLWAPGADPGYSLIVDGEVTVDEATEVATLVPTGAVLHRVAGASGPTCKPV